MAAPFLGDVVSVATDWNQISLGNPAMRHASIRLLSSTAVGRLEVLSDAIGFEAKTSS